MPHPTFPIQTPRLDLRPFVEDDFADMHAYHALPEVARFLYWEARSEQEARATLHIKKHQTVLTHEGSALCLAVCLSETQRLIGEVTLFLRSKDHQQGEIGFVFHPGFGGYGYATEAAGALLTLGFDTYKLHRICGRCDARNVSSYRLMERLGMRREAHFIHNERFKGEWGDELVYALLCEEWQAVPARNIQIDKAGG